MTDDFLEQMLLLERYASGLQSILTGAQAYLPSEARGTDPAGAVTVVVDETGLPSSFAVARDWQERVGAEMFTAAVIQAYYGAMGNRMAVWAESLEEEQIQDQIEQLQRPGGHGRVSGAEPTIPPARVSPRPVSEIAEDLIGAFDLVKQPVKPQTCAGGSGKLTLTLSARALTGCDAEPDWLAPQTATMLTNTLNAALAHARDELSATEPPSGLSAQLDALINEAFALMPSTDTTRRD